MLEHRHAEIVTAHVGTEAEQHGVEAGVVHGVACSRKSGAVGGGTDQPRLEGVARTEPWGRRGVGGIDLGAAVAHAPSSVAAGLVAGGTGRSSNPARIACPRSKSAR